MLLGSEQDRLIGENSAIQRVRDEMLAAARSDAKVLITGETGVGKDIVARLIHRASRRSAGRLVAVNCAGVPETLLESELFGHARGSFTGAVRDSTGLLESANEGTIFFDEIGEMSLRMQAVLLRFLETGEIQRVGATQSRGSLSVRCIAATNRDLLPQIDAGAFRQDLYYRINVLRIAVPPLRERGDDILLLLEHFLRRYGMEHGTSRSRISSGAERILLSYPWPGNVRQLKNVAERLTVQCAGPVIDEGALPPELLDHATTSRQTTHAAGASRRTDDDLLVRMQETGASFWSVVHAPYMRHDLSRAEVRAVIVRGLEKTGGSYRDMLALFNMPANDGRRFQAFLRHHDCRVPGQAYRFAVPERTHSTQPLKVERRAPVPFARVG